MFVLFFKDGGPAGGKQEKTRFICASENGEQAGVVPSRLSSGNGFDTRSKVLIMTTPFRIVALAGDEFASLFEQTDARLAEQGIRRVIADRKPGFPCRVSLADAEPGEELLLLPFTHQPADTPYRASGPIFVRQGAVQAYPRLGEIPESIRGRLLSVRAYDDDHTIVGADVCEGRDLEPVIDRFFADARVKYVHLHNARPGCYACRVERA
jgi:hypothetical protein